MPSGEAATNGQVRAAPVKTTGASKREKLKAQQAALEARLDRLRDILAQKVEDAKGRSGIESKTTAAKSKDAATKTESTKDDKPLTESQKKEKAEKARETYEKENGPNLSQEVAQLQRQIQDIRAQIQEAIEDARNRSSQSKLQTASKGR
jgi:hypothetical protein